MAARVEDQLMIGNEIMIAPVYEQNGRGRYVYLPEEMIFIKFLPGGDISEEVLEQGIHYVISPSTKFAVCTKREMYPCCSTAECVDEIDTEHLGCLIAGAEYFLTMTTEYIKIMKMTKTAVY